MRAERRSLCRRCLRQGRAAFLGSAAAAPPAIAREQQGGGTPRREEIHAKCSCQVSPMAQCACHSPPTIAAAPGRTRCSRIRTGPARCVDLQKQRAAGEPRGMSPTCVRGGRIANAHVFRRVAAKAGDGKPAGRTRVGCAASCGASVLPQRKLRGEPGTRFRAMWRDLTGRGGCLPVRPPVPRSGLIRHALAGLPQHRLPRCSELGSTPARPAKEPAARGGVEAGGRSGGRCGWAGRREAVAGRERRRGGAWAPAAETPGRRPARRSRCGPGSGRHPRNWLPMGLVPGIGALGTLQGQGRKRAADPVLVAHLPLRPSAASFRARLAAYRSPNGGVAGNSFRPRRRLSEHGSGLPPARSTKEP